jgi:hypothetical protein
VIETISRGVNHYRRGRQTAEYLFNLGATMTKLEKLAATRGFKEIPEYMWWFNVDARMGFSHDAARDADEKWFTEQLSAKVNPGDFIFYFSRLPKDSESCEAMLARFGLSDLNAVIRLIKQAR